MLVVSFDVPIISNAATEVIPRDWKKYKSTYYYDSLNEKEKAIYDELERDCIDFISGTSEPFYSEKNYLGFSGGYNYIGGVKVPKDMSMFEVSDIMEQFVYDNPQYYFLDKDFVMIYGNLFEFYMALCVNDKFIDGEYRAQVTNEFFNKVEGWEAEIKAAGPSEYNMEMKANEIVCNNVKYVAGDLDQLSYSAVIEGATVCTGYAKTISMLLNSVGIPTMVVISNSHAWNKVYLDGTWYESDTTWNDSWNNAIAGKDYENQISNIYSNVSTATMHMLDDSQAHNVRDPKYHPDCNNDYDDTEKLYYYIVDGNKILIYKRDDPNFKNIYYLSGINPESNSSNVNGNNGQNSSNTGAGANASNSGSAGTSAGSKGDFGNKSGSANQPKYSNEWVGGKWYNADGSQTYEGLLIWMSDSKGWWVEDTSGWYPTSSWQKIDGKWYYFTGDGYMASNEWYDGCWLSSNGAWEYQGIGSWAGNSAGWWFQDDSGWYAFSCWQKINGYWYYFGADGYMVSNCYIDGWWISSDGVCY